MNVATAPSEKLKIDTDHNMSFHTSPDRRKSRSQEIFETIRQAIINNEMHPGDAISKEQLCEKFDVSRTPASDALNRLAEQGLVDIFPQHGTFVSKIVLTDIQENAFLRECIETGIVRCLTNQLDKSQIAQLETNMRIQRVLSEAADFEGFYKHDKEFHELLIDFSELRRAKSTLQPVLTHLERIRKMIVPLPERMQEALYEHEAILEALKGSEPLKTEEAMRHHLSESMRAIETVVSAHPEIFE